MMQLTACSYEWGKENGGVPQDRIYCPMTRYACMGRNCAATREINKGVWTCIAYNGDNGPVVDRVSKTCAKR